MIDDAKALSLARDAFNGSTSYFDGNIRTRIEQDIRRFQSRFPSGSKYLSDGYKTRSRIFRPKTRATIRKNEAVAAEAFFSTIAASRVTSFPTAASSIAAWEVMSQQQPFLDPFVVGDGDDYERLPEPIKFSHTRAQFMWLSDAQKANLIDQECEPEW